MKKIILLCILLFNLLLVNNSFAGYFSVGTFPGNDNDLACFTKVETIPYSADDFIVTEHYWCAVDPSIRIFQYAVKAGNEYTLFEWDGEGTNRFDYFNSDKDISHVSFCGCTCNKPVPIPGAFILLFSGLGTLCIFRKKKLK